MPRAADRFRGRSGLPRETVQSVLVRLTGLGVNTEPLGVTGRDLPLRGETWGEPTLSLLGQTRRCEIALFLGQARRYVVPLFLGKTGGQLTNPLGQTGREILVACQERWKTGVVGMTLIEDGTKRRGHPEKGQGGDDTGDRQETTHGEQAKRRVTTSPSRFGDGPGFEGAAVDLPEMGLRELVDEVDLSRVLVRLESLQDPVHQVLTLHVC